MEDWQYSSGWVEYVKTGRMYGEGQRERQRLLNGSKIESESAWTTHGSIEFGSAKSLGKLDTSCQKHGSAVWTSRD